MREQPEALDVARTRRPPSFFIVDASLRVCFTSAPAAGEPGDDVPDDLRVTLSRLLAEMETSGDAAAFAMSSATELIRVQRLEGRNAQHHYAVFRERFAVRNSVQNAAERFGLSRRETDVLEGLMRGEGTSEIAGRLNVAPTTVQEHVRNIGRKANVSKRSAIVALVIGL
jgi:DNA-binding CsgD family transcriptional regulator